MWDVPQALWHVPKADVHHFRFEDQIIFVWGCLNFLHHVFTEFHQMVHVFFETFITLDVSARRPGKKITSELGQYGKNYKIYQLKSNSCYTHTLARHCSQSLNTSLWRPHCITLSPVSYWMSYSLSCINKYSALIWLQLINSPWNNIMWHIIALWLNISYLKHDVIFKVVTHIGNYQNRMYLQGRILGGYWWWSPPKLFLYS